MKIWDKTLITKAFKCEFQLVTIEANAITLLLNVTNYNKRCPYMPNDFIELWLNSLVYWVGTNELQSHFVVVTLDIKEHNEINIEIDLT